MSLLRLFFPFLIALPALCSGAEAVLQEALEPKPCYSTELVAAIDRLVALQAQENPDLRLSWWHRDFSSREAYEKSVQPNRDRLRQLLGAGDHPPPDQQGSENQAKIAQTEAYDVFAVQWPVLAGVFGEGLWLKPKKQSQALIIAIPDADQEPESVAGLSAGLKPELQFARRAVENGFEVLVPVLISPTNGQRDWICQKAFGAGRHIVGLEAQKIIAAVDWWLQSATKRNERSGSHLKIGLMGYGEGGFIALCASALDTRIDATLVSGYFQTQANAWRKPAYRNVFGLAREFGDAEMATLVAPRALLVEHAPAPARMEPLEFESVEGEIIRAKSLLQNGGKAFDQITFICGTEGRLVGPVGEGALTQFLQALGLKADQLKDPGIAPRDLRVGFHPQDRQNSQVAQLAQFLSPGILRDLLGSQLFPIPLDPDHLLHHRLNQ